MNTHVCLSAEKSMGIVEKISSCVLNMDSSGGGGWVVKIARVGCLKKLSRLASWSTRQRRSVDEYVGPLTW